MLSNTVLRLEEYVKDNECQCDFKDDWHECAVCQADDLLEDIHENLVRFIDELDIEC